MLPDLSSSISFLALSKVVTSSFNQSIALSKVLSTVRVSTFSKDFLAASTSLLSRLVSMFFNSLAILISVFMFLKIS